MKIQSAHVYPRNRIGSARRDLWGTRVPGEQNEQGQVMETADDGLRTGGLTSGRLVTGGLATGRRVSPIVPAQPGAAAGAVTGAQGGAPAWARPAVAAAPVSITPNLDALKAGTVTPNLNRLQSANPSAGSAAAAWNYTPAERIAALQRLRGQSGAEGLNIGGGRVIPDEVPSTLLSPTVSRFQTPGGGEDIITHAAGGERRAPNVVGHIQGSISPGWLTDSAGNRIASPAGEKPSQSLQWAQQHGQDWQQKIITAHPEIGQEGTPENAAFTSAMKSSPSSNPWQVAMNIYHSPTPQAATVSPMSVPGYSDPSSTTPTMPKPANPSPMAPATNFASAAGSVQPVQGIDWAAPKPATMSQAVRDSASGLAGAVGNMFSQVRKNANDWRENRSLPVAIDKPAAMPQMDDDEQLGAVGGAVAGSRLTWAKPRKAATPLMDRVAQGY